jgi:hypothetical protein
MIDPSVSLLVALAFAALFGSAAVTKLRAPAIFVATLADYRIVPRALVPTTGALVITLEGAVALGLVLPATRAVCALAGAGLLLVYGAAIAINLVRGRREIDCGCSLQRRPIGRWMVVRNVSLAAALLVCAVPISERALGIADAVTIGAGLFVLILLYASLDLLLGRKPAWEHS